MNSSGKKFLEFTSTKKDFMSSSNPSRRSERAILPRFILSRNLTTIKTMPSRPSPKKPPTVKKMENNAWSRKSKSWGNSITRTLWNFMKSLSQKIRFISFLNLLKVVHCTKKSRYFYELCRKSTSLSPKMYNTLLKGYLKAWRTCTPKRSCTETSSPKTFF